MPLPDNMPKNRLLIACAGSGKTTYLVKEALNIKDKNILITTYTDTNTEEIYNKFIEVNNCVPKNITIQTWFSFLLQHGVRPYQSVMDSKLYDKKIGFFFCEDKSGFRYEYAGKKTYWGEKDFYHYYFTEGLKIYSDKISKFIFNCNKKTKKELINRLSRIYPYIFIDEVQDLAGWDLEILKLLFDTKSNILLVGDPRQTTYSTHWDTKNSNYKRGNIVDFIKNECPTANCEPDYITLNKSHRNNQEICIFSSKLFKEYPLTEPCVCPECRNNHPEHTGIFLVRKCDAEKYCKEFRPTILKLRLAIFPEWNFGKSKGKTFNNVLIYPTEDMTEWVKNNETILKFLTRCKFYVAITRARYSVGIIYDYQDRDIFDGIKKYS
ncbi:superfamily I DNA or RNA helicase [Candidatus Termititenax persephonae]|uniref:Superfamily I DNA or RNA helicase n=1 Tax=Candidatus Termititenax persephonae TaxID=2218525 RepID=A0A388TGW8_9BACT|nr:superfamily I DNA or RNA helicase [Candidatus Termititenax persephonae]